MLSDIIVSRRSFPFFFFFLSISHSFYLSTFIYHLNALDYKSTFFVKVKGKGRYSSSWKPHLKATGRHLPYGITQCYLPPDTSERAQPNPSLAGRYSIYLPRRDGRL